MQEDNESKSLKKNLPENAFNQMDRQSFAIRLIKKIRSLDIFSIPISFTYNSRSSFSTKYGIVFSLIIFLFCILIVLDNVAYFQYRNSCSLPTIENPYPSSYSIDLKNELVMYFIFRDADTNKTLNPVSEKIFEVKFQAYTNNIVKNKVNREFYSTNITFKNCKGESSVEDFYTAYQLSSDCEVLCSENSEVTFSDPSLYNTKILISVINKLIDKASYDFTYKNLVAEFYVRYLSYSSRFNTFEIGYTKEIIKFGDFVMDDIVCDQTSCISSSSTIPNVFTTSLQKYQHQTYYGYFNLGNSFTYYKLSPIKLSREVYREGSVFVNIQINLPINIQVIHNQTVNYLHTIGVTVGWLILAWIFLNFFASKFTRLEMYETLVNMLHSLIDPKNKDMIKNTEKTIQERLAILSSGKQKEEKRLELLPLMVDDAYKYKNHDQMTLNFMETVSYFFCCFCCKTSSQVCKHRTLSKSISELSRTMNIITLVKTCQQIRLLKEIIFEPYQKRVFEHLIPPIVTEDNCISVYKMEHLDIEAQTEIEKDTMVKANLKDAVIMLANSEDRNAIEAKLISLLNVSNDIKGRYFHEDPVRSRRYRTKYSILKNSGKEHNWEKIVPTYRAYIDLLNENNDFLVKCNNVLINETTELMKGYKVLFEENMILKETIYGAGRIRAGNEYEENLKKHEELKLASYHPLILSSDKNKEQLEYSRMINVIRENSKVLTIVEGFFSGIFTFIDAIFCIRGRVKYINREYNMAIQFSFDAIKHCIHISFLIFLTFSYFFFKSVDYNHESSQCKIDFLCYGFLSFHQKPEDIIFTFTFSNIFYVIVLATYSFHLMVQYTLTEIEDKYIKDKYALSKKVFTDPSVKIFSIGEAIHFRESLLISINNDFNRDKCWNFVVTLLHVIVILVNVIAILSSFQIFNSFIYSEFYTSYHLKCLVHSVGLTVIINGFLSLNFYLITFYKNQMPRTRHFYKFWIPFVCKFSAYLMILCANLNIFMGTNGGYFYTNFTVAYHKDLFICREDQAAYDLLMFAFVEFVIRKLFLIFLSRVIAQKQYPYSVDQSIVHTMCLFFVLSIITLVFPMEGVITVFIFFISYHLEFIILKKYKSKPHSYEYDKQYQVYIIWSLLANLIAIIVISIFFHNQFNIMQNAVPEIANNSTLRQFYPIMCLHQNFNDDYQFHFREYFSMKSLAIYQSAQIFILLPAIVGLIILIIYSKNFFNKFSNDLKYLLTSVEDKSWNTVANTINVYIRKISKMNSENEERKNELLDVFCKIDDEIKENENNIY